MNNSSDWALHPINIWDYVLLPVYLAIIFFIAKVIKRKMVSQSIESKYFIPGLFYKIIGGIGVCLIYVYYYGGGDTVEYYVGTVDLASFVFKKSAVVFSILSGNLSMENYSQLNNTHTWSYLYRDPNSYSVIRFTFLLSFLGLYSYILITILLASLSYIGLWKLFALFLQEFKEIKNQLAFAILFIPSVAFWGSGILKDTYALAATCLLFYSSYSLFLKRKKITKNIIVIIICSYVLFSIRPYMLFIGLDSIIIMLTYGYLAKAKTAFIRFVSFFVIIIFVWGGGLIAFVYIGTHASGAYGSIDSVLERAVVTQQDLVSENYGNNSFDIGKFEPTIPGILSKAPLAINAGLFYPYIWKARNPVMLISGLENLILLMLTLYVFLLMIIATFRNGVKYMLKTTFDHPIIIFSIVYSLQYAFMVGLTSANYGALVRYKIPLIPFYMATLFIIIYKFNRENAVVSDKSLRF